MDIIYGGGNGTTQFLPIGTGGINSATDFGGNGAVGLFSGGGGGAGKGSGGSGGVPAISIYGAGGAGGVHGYVGAAPISFSRGTDGTRGGDGTSNGDGGGGGAGGYGAVLTGVSGTVTLWASVTGGNGGGGGNSSFYQPGSGGRGGIGLYVDDVTGTSITVAASIIGGAGGRVGTGFVPASSGAGGEGIRGQNLTVALVDGSSISGGMGGDGTRASAIHFEAGTNLLEIQGGSILGNVVGGTGTDMLSLSGDTGGSFDMSTIFNFETLGSAGTATWTLAGTNSDIQTWTAASGNILVTGSLANTKFVVTQDAMLGGTGTVGTVEAAGTVSAGIGRGTLTTGDFTLANTGTLEVEIASVTPGKFDQVKVAGTVSLAGQLDLALSSRLAASIGDSFTLIDNDGTDAVSGAFAGLAEGAVFSVGGKSFGITYRGGTGNDVTLTLVNPTVPNAAPVVSNPNADLSLQAGTALLLTVGDGHFRDPEGADLDYTITVDGATKPAWLTFDAETGLITGTPTTSEAGSYSIRIAASDGSLTANDDFTLVITSPGAGLDTTGTRRHDVIVGDAADNVMDGRGGNDKLTGGDGADTFVLDQNYGRDVVLDFHPEDGDLIDLSGAIGIRGFQDLMKNHVFDSGDDIRIRADDGSTLVIRDFEPADLTRDMFLF
jgi:hypothetical protein